jgi:hypothetical protein
MAKTIAGVLSFEMNGARHRIKGHVTYNLGYPVKEEIVGADGVHGYKENHQAARVEFTSSDHADLKLSDLLEFEGTANLHLSNGKVITLQEGWFGGEGDVNTEESEITMKLVGVKAVEVRP